MTESVTVQQFPYVGRDIHYVAMGSKGDEYPSTCRAAVITELPSVHQIVTGKHREGEVGCIVFNPTGVHHRPLGHFPVCDYLPPYRREENVEPELVGGTWHYVEECMAAKAVPSLLLRPMPREISEQEAREIAERFKVAVNARSTDDLGGMQIVERHRERDVVSTTSVPAASLTPVSFVYQNYRGETGQRTVTPRRIWYGTNEWHTEPGWMLEAWDHDREAMRTFSMSMVRGWSEVQ